MKHPPYSVVPRPRDRLSVVLLALLMAAALALFYLSTLLPSGRAAAQLLGFVALVAMVYLIVRTRTPYLYRIEDDAQEAGESDLVIVRHHGRQRITACRLALRDIREIGVATGENRRSLRERYRGKTVHDYCPTLFPERSLYLMFEDSDPYAAPTATEEEREAAHGERIILHIAYDETILRALRTEQSHRNR